ncbi:hypothetical protein GCM10010922_14930 [Microbacterium sorbitolivorans]|uniref:Uncharacterized protein n=1 Tax=Microbacterium sorbitolivorans TaxID=1867410 RepID=A0A367Y1V8_9MICO|nr:hypothetical protein [Microbacterium sorbitolivorans]RCK59853.1 hypothetical protein DTO57_06740 [Microbacterium sorbitolivorans]GGF40529.1 hypothetical protein GCM10010922_14930 [Microbacterium sorbitolivorans]
MNAAGRLGLYGVGVVVAFGAAFGIGAAVVPESAVADWTEAAASGHEDMDMAPELELDPTSTSEVDGFTVALDGELIAGESSEFAASFARGGDPVTDLESNLGTAGRLVALRDGNVVDVRAEGDTAGPDITFAAEAPTAGRYLLYLDFQVDGQVHTASFVVDAGYGH